MLHKKPNLFRRISIEFLDEDENHPCGQPIYPRLVNRPGCEADI